MSEADDLKLNTLERFSKKSDHLTLEEHGHCEVPAGCGGVILRWYNPSSALPVLFHVFNTSPAKGFINGVPMESSRPLVPPGPVVLAFEFKTAPLLQGLFMFGGVRSPDLNMRNRSQVLVRSGGDGAWRFTLSRPQEGWTLPDFDASSWGELVERSLAPPSKDEYHRRAAYDHLREIGAQPIGIPTGQHVAAFLGGLGKVPVWVRTVFLNKAHNEP